jgi:hypothetical protein
LFSPAILLVRSPGPNATSGAAGQPEGDAVEDAVDDVISIPVVVGCHQPVAEQHGNAVDG